MTGEQVIKALEQCGNIIVSSCKDCPLHEKYNANCVRELTKDALDLIKRQQAEIYNLKEDLSEYRNMPILTKNDCLIATVEKRADGKRYHNALLTIKVDEIRAEACKEFAERLNKNFETYTDDEEKNALYMRNLINNLVKELTEVSNGE